ncbi:hypothetical protein QBC35DRAFT_542295 [Podospora australis]|uniref:Uncharacterized protein n=1 Tax=Podospora australis TaxID=1536484 RepID=A0AAN7AFA7_9PEZI|nr:hypothetical protein QBC35DRAFT_542295 [Podospora australis]
MSSVSGKDQICEEMLRDEDEDAFEAGVMDLIPNGEYLGPGLPSLPGPRRTHQEMAMPTWTTARIQRETSARLGWATSLIAARMAAQSPAHSGSGPLLLLLLLLFVTRENLGLEQMVQFSIIICYGLKVLASLRSGLKWQGLLIVVWLPGPLPGLFRLPCSYGSSVLPDQSVLYQQPGPSIMVVPVMPPVGSSWPSWLPGPDILFLGIPLGQCWLSSDEFCGWTEPEEYENEDHAENEEDDETRTEVYEEGEGDGEKEEKKKAADGTRKAKDRLRARDRVVKSGAAWCAQSCVIQRTPRYLSTCMTLTEASEWLRSLLLATGNMVYRTQNYSLSGPRQEQKKKSVVKLRGCTGVVAYLTVPSQQMVAANSPSHQSAMSRPLQGSSLQGKSFMHQPAPYHTAAHQYPTTVILVLLGGTASVSTRLNRVAAGYLLDAETVLVMCRTRFSLPAFQEACRRFSAESIFHRFELSGFLFLANNKSDDRRCWLLSPTSPRRRLDLCTEIQKVHEQLPESLKKSNQPGSQKDPKKKREKIQRPTAVQDMGIAERKTYDYGGFQHWSGMRPSDFARVMVGTEIHRLPWGFWFQIPSSKPPSTSEAWFLLARDSVGQEGLEVDQEDLHSWPRLIAESSDRRQGAERRGDLGVPIPVPLAQSR